MSPTFDRFDIAEAHLVLEWDYNIGGWFPDRPSNARRSEATGAQLYRMGFRFRPSLCRETLSENGEAIYRELVRRYKLEPGTIPATPSTNPAELAEGESE